MEKIKAELLSEKNKSMECREQLDKANSRQE